MIIEDDPDTIELLQVILQLRGYDPIPAEGGVTGLRLLREKGADLILLDLMMDDMDGWAVLETVKADERLCPIPVIIVSVKHELEDLPRMKAHADKYVSYIVKPFTVRGLLSEIEGVLS